MLGGDLVLFIGASIGLWDVGVSKMNASLQSIEEEQGKSGLNWRGPAYINREKSLYLEDRVMIFWLKIMR